MSKRLKYFVPITAFILFFGTIFFRCTLPDTPDEIPPDVAIIYPVAGQAVSGEVNITVGASDNDKLDFINLFVDGVKVASTQNTTLEYLWDTTPIADNRDHSITATATDHEGNTTYAPPITVRVVTGTLPDTLPPVVTILNPVPGARVNDTVHVITQITDDSKISKVEYYVDGSLTYTSQQSPFEFLWDVSGYPNGSSHSIFAKAYDENLNSSTSNVVTVTVQQQDITPPTVTILYPPAGTSVDSSETVNISVDVNDDVGVDRVEFYIDGDLLSTDTTAPYKYGWDTTGYRAGRSHTIYVKAYDPSGNSGAQLTTVILNSP